MQMRLTMQANSSSGDTKAVRRSAALRVVDFVRGQDGVAAIEFAMVGPPFIALLLAIFETGIAFFAQQVLQTAALQASRAIMTGQVQTTGVTAKQFQQSVCNSAGTLFDCKKVMVNVQTQASFGAALPSPISNGKAVTGTNFNPGIAGDIVIVQVYYEWTVWTGPLNFKLANLSDGNDLLVATTAFRNEHYH
jgi:Flp pilus assembly protein TadG